MKLASILALLLLSACSRLTEEDKAALAKSCPGGQVHARLDSSIKRDAQIECVPVEDTCPDPPKPFVACDSQYDVIAERKLLKKTLMYRGNEWPACPEGQFHVGDVAVSCIPCDHAKRPPLHFVNDMCLGTGDLKIVVDEKTEKCTYLMNGRALKVKTRTCIVRFEQDCMARRVEGAQMDEDAINECSMWKK